MNPINAINQEFARNVIEEWSDAATIRQHEQEVDEAHGGIVAAIRALVLWGRGCIGKPHDTSDVLLLRESTKK
jgi:hypothetical protein